MESTVNTLQLSEGANRIIFSFSNHQNQIGNKIYLYLEDVPDLQHTWVGIWICLRDLQKQKGAQFLVEILSACKFGVREYLH